MARTIIIVLAILMLVNVLALLGLVGYGAATGRFSQDKMDQYMATWQGEKLVPYVEEEEVVVTEETPQAAAARIESARIDREELGRNIQLQLQLLKNKQFTLVQARSKLEKDIDGFKVEQEEFQAELDRQNRLAREERFLRVLKNYSGMSPKLVKDDFMQMNEQDVVRYLAAMKSNVATDILSKFKTPQEKAKRVKLLKLLEKHKVIQVTKAN